MASITFNITNADVDLLAKSLNYPTTIPDPQDPALTIPNPMTKGAYCKAWVVSALKERVLNQKAQDAVVAANLVSPDIT